MEIDHLGQVEGNRLYINFNKACELSALSRKKTEGHNFKSFCANFSSRTNRKTHENNNNAIIGTSSVLCFSFNFSCIAA